MRRMRRRGAAGSEASAEDINNLCSIKQFSVRKKGEKSEKKRKLGTKRRQRKGKETKQNQKGGKVGSWSRRDVYLKPEQLLVYTNRILRRNLFKCVFKRQVLLL